LLIWEKASILADLSSKIEGGNCPLRQDKKLTAGRLAIREEKGDKTHKIK